MKTLIKQILLGNYKEDCKLIVNKNSNNYYFCNLYKEKNNKLSFQINPSNINNIVKYTLRIRMDALYDELIVITYDEFIELIYLANKIYENNIIRCINELEKIITRE